MASVFKRTRWIDADGRKCRKGTPGARKAKSRFWTIVFVGPDGRPHRRRGYADKLSSLQLGADLERAKARGEMHLIDAYAPHRKRPLAEHIADYVAHLKTLNRDGKYVEVVEKRLNVLATECGWRTTADVTAGSFMAWRSKGREVRRGVEKVHRTGDGKALVGGVTLNRFLEAAHGFLNWMVRPAKRIAANPLADVPKVDATGDVRRARRALTAAQVGALLAVVPPRYQRAYRFLLATGLRRQEAADLVWGDVKLNAPTPFIKLRAKATKARRADNLPLRPDLAAELASDRGDAPDGANVFAAVPSIDEHREYLTAAKIDWKDDEGRRVDVHALRMTFGTLLSASGTSPREAMELMRHTDLRLTMKVYTDPKIFNLAGAVGRLPLPPLLPGKAIATGTDGGTAGSGAERRTESGTESSSAIGMPSSAIGSDAALPTSQNHREIGCETSSLAAIGRDDVKAPQVGLEPTSDAPDLAGNPQPEHPGAQKTPLDFPPTRGAELRHDPARSDRERLDAVAGKIRNLCDRGGT